MKNVSVKKKRLPRFKALSPATAWIEDKSYSLQCIIRDISVDGAKIYAKDIEDLPEKILLTVDGLDSDIQARIIWREGKLCGVQIDWEKTLFE
jgi:PilZ domain